MNWFDNLVTLDVNSKIWIRMEGFGRNLYLDVGNQRCSQRQRSPMYLKLAVLWFLPAQTGLRFLKLKKVNR